MDYRRKAMYMYHVTNGFFEKMNYPIRNWTIIIIIMTQNAYSPEILEKHPFICTK